MGPIVGREKAGSKPIIFARGMFGIGDCIFQRAIIRELMTKGEVHLDTYYSDMYWDLMQAGLFLNVTEDRGRIRDSANRSQRKGIPPIKPRNPETVRITYDKNMIHANGSILAAMFKSANLTMPQKPDFSMPVKPEWVDKWRQYLRQECVNQMVRRGDKPLMVYRPIVLNSQWTASARSPDPASYDAIYQSIRKDFFVVSIADLRGDQHNGQIATKSRDGHSEWIVGPQPDVDLRFHKGELDFATLCGLFKDSTLAFTNPGFCPVIAQAVGTPSIIVYGANESFRTTNSVGKHLAPTLAIDIDNPCEHHTQQCTCAKTITIQPALERTKQFTQQVLRGDFNVDDTKESVKKELEYFDEHADRFAAAHKGIPAPAPRILIFGTTYIDTPERAQLTTLWYEHHRALNPDCDLMLVDSASPLFPKELVKDSLYSEYASGHNEYSWSGTDASHKKGFTVLQFRDNIGHLSRNGPKGPTSKGRDGWGRAFSMGLDYACQNANPSPAPLQRRYDYVVHIEGDSLFKHPVRPIVKRMRSEGVGCVTVPVVGTKNVEVGWVETGLMFFSTKYLEEHQFTQHYDWANRKESPTPERVIFEMLKADAERGSKFKLYAWSALRGDKQQIKADNICFLDWVTHVRNHVGLDDMKLFKQYSEHCRSPILPTRVDALPESSVAVQPEGGPASGRVAPTVMVSKPARRDIVGSDLLPSVKINLGCGTNKLDGWQNFDSEVNINLKLPFKHDYADVVFAEHVVEHTSYYKALSFFVECRRVLKPGGLIRITTPSLERIMKYADEEYFEFVHSRKWAPTKDRRGAMHAILHCHGHQTAWTGSLLIASLYYAGFKDLAVCKTGESSYETLRNVEGHHRVIGQKFNDIESISVEGVVDK